MPRQAALADIDAALDWYRDQGALQAAHGFVDALEAAFRHISDHPASGSPRFAHELQLPGLRSWGLTAYPYLVFYLERTDHVDVWRVLHMQRDMAAWLSENP